MAGITWLRAILAVLSTPQRIFDIDSSREHELSRAIIRFIDRFVHSALGSTPVQRLKARRRLRLSWK